MRHPVHVTLRVRRDVSNLRRYTTFQAIRAALSGGKRRFGVGLVEYSVQRNHLHLMMEAADRRCLSRAMQGLGVRLAKAINKACGRSGSVFAERYHARSVKSALEVWRVLHYVLNNARRHAADHGYRYGKDWLDPCSSARHFDGWDGRAPPPQRDLATVPPRTALLATAWRAYGLLEPW
jgi:putative transposase